MYPLDSVRLDGVASSHVAVIVFRIREVEVEEEAGCRVSFYVEPLSWDLSYCSVSIIVVSIIRSQVMWVAVDWRIIFYFFLDVLSFGTGL